MDNYIFLGFPSENTMRLIRTDSTNRVRKDATFSRRLSEFQSQTKVYSVPELAATYRQDVPDTEGNPTGQRASAGYSIRVPVGAAESVIDQVIADMRADVNAADFKTRVISQLFPSVTSSE